MSMQPNFQSTPKVNASVADLRDEELVGELIEGFVDNSLP